MILEQKEDLTHWQDYHHHHHPHSDSCSLGQNRSGSQIWGRHLLCPGSQWVQCGRCCWGGLSSGQAWYERCIGMQILFPVGNQWKREHRQPADGGWPGHDARTVERNGWKGWRHYGRWCHHCHSMYYCPGNWEKMRKGIVRFWFSHWEIFSANYSSSILSTLCKTKRHGRGSSTSVIQKPLLRLFSLWVEDA